MIDTPLTLKDFLSADPSKPIAGGLDLSSAMPAIASAAATLPSAAAQQVTDTFKPALDEILNIGIGDVLAASWGKVSALRDAILSTRKDQALIAIVPLFDHKITSKHAPSIDLTYAGKTLASFAFEVVINFALKGVMLDIRQGRVAGIKGGTAQGDGALNFLGKPLLQHKSREFILPGRLTFTDPPKDPTKTMAQ